MTSKVIYSVDSLQLYVVEEDTSLPQGLIPWASETICKERTCIPV